MDFIAVDKYCLVRDKITSKVYCIPDFDIETLKLFTFVQLEELQKKSGKNAYSVTIYYYDGVRLIGNITLSIQQFFINFDPNFEGFKEPHFIDVLPSLINFD